MARFAFGVGRALAGLLGVRRVGFALGLVLFVVVVLVCCVVLSWCCCCLFCLPASRLPPRLLRLAAVPLPLFLPLLPLFFFCLLAAAPPSPASSPLFLARFLLFLSTPHFHDGFRLSVIRLDYECLERVGVEYLLPFIALRAVSCYFLCIHNNAAVKVIVSIMKSTIVQDVGFQATFGHSPQAGGNSSPAWDHRSSE